MKYFLFFLLLFSCNADHSVLKGSCQLGETRTFDAPNREQITATLQGIGYLHLSGNLNLVPENILVSTELGDTVYVEYETWLLTHGDHWSFEMCLAFDGAEHFEFELPYIDQ